MAFSFDRISMYLIFHISVCYPCNKVVHGLGNENSNKSSSNGASNLQQLTSNMKSLLDMQFGVGVRTVEDWIQNLGQEVYKGFNF